MTMGTRTCRVLRIAVLSQPTDEELRDVLRYVGQPYRALAIGQSHEPRRCPGGWVRLELAVAPPDDGSLDLLALFRASDLVFAVC